MLENFNSFFQFDGAICKGSIVDIQDYGGVMDIVTHKCPPKEITVCYTIDGILYTNNLIAKYIDPIQLNDLQIGKSIKVKYDINNPDSAYLLDFTYFSTLGK